MSWFSSKEAADYARFVVRSLKYVYSPAVITCCLGGDGWGMSRGEEERECEVEEEAGVLLHV